MDTNTKNLLAEHFNDMTMLLQELSMSTTDQLRLAGIKKMLKDIAILAHAYGIETTDITE